MNRSKSTQLFEKAKTLFPGGVNSPVRAFKSVGGNPLFMESGKGPRLYDADGNSFIDYCGSWGPLIHGHAYPAVIDAVSATMVKGTSFGTPTALENSLAELIIGNIPFIERIRFVSSGTEAVMSAVRLARGYTGRNKIIKFEGCYHGHSDGLLVKAGSGLVTAGNASSAGVPPNVVEDTITVPLNDEEAIKQAFSKHQKEIACVIIEPVPANNGLLLQGKAFLSFLRDICTANGALLIFDEVISGFRLGFSGAAGLYGIKPDLVTYGKIIGGGFPVGAYAGPQKIMTCIAPEGNVYQAGTLSGNPVAMSAGYAQLSACLQDGFYGKLEQMTGYLVMGLRTILQPAGFKVFSLGSIFWITHTEQKQVTSASQVDPASMKIFSCLYNALLEEGVYFGPSGYEVGFVSSVHGKTEIDETIAAFKRAKEKLNI